MVFAVLTLVLSLTSGSALADPGGNGNGKGQAKKAEVTTTESSTPGPSADSNGPSADSNGPPAHSNSKSAKHKDSPVQETTATSNSDKGKSKVVSGETGQPQPKSNADLNPGGANNGGDCGSYCSTRDGTPSGNGQGKNGIEAGSKGRADNKNPPGQFKDGSDANNGYECDGNNGIAKGNPAHTACTSAVEEPPECPPGSDNSVEPCDDLPGQECPPGSDNSVEPCDDQPGQECPEGSDNMTPPCDDQPGQECPEGSDNMTPPCEDEETAATRVPPETAVLGVKVGATTAAAVAAALARTGVEAGGLALAGGLLLAAGASGLVIGRKRRRA
ncbi:MAG TPA: hypothetical protein VFD41_06880 [Actinomycetales bacterium]|nr:hypothetical protein [Actinomycetales bacterium]